MPVAPRADDNAGNNRNHRENARRQRKQQAKPKEANQQQPEVRLSKQSGNMARLVNAGFERGGRRRYERIGKL